MATYASNVAVIQLRSAARRVVATATALWRVRPAVLRAKNAAMAPASKPSVAATATAVPAKPALTDRAAQIRAARPAVVRAKPALMDRAAQM
jgi:hypothetical protein